MGKDVSDTMRDAIGHVVRDAIRNPRPREGQPAPATGREWLLGRLQSGQRDDRLAAAVHEPLAALAAAAVERGLQPVLTLVELLRQLMERQALRRVEAGGLDEEQVERLGRTLMLLEARMGELREAFGLSEEDLNLDLGPLGRLL